MNAFLAVFFNLAGPDLIILAPLLGVIGFILWMLIDCLSSGLPALQKIIWAVVICAGPILGAALYLLAGRPRRGGQ